MNKQELISKIQKIIRKSDAFKIGETGSSVEERLSQYKTEFTKIEKITSSKNKETIDKYESQMNQHFIKHPKNKNTNKGSAGTMTDKSEVYTLYVVYNPKKQSK